LRLVAEDLLSHGQAPPTRGWELGTDALALLYRLASDCNRADDALAMLHELQVHQVELDLQLQQRETNEAELIDELQRYRSLYEQAPVGYLQLRPDGSIIEANVMAHRLLAPAGGDIRFCSEDEPRIDQLLRPEDRPALAAMLEQLDAGHPVTSCDVEAIDAAADAPPLKITVRLEPGSANVWMTVS